MTKPVIPEDDLEGDEPEVADLAVDDLVTDDLEPDPHAATRDLDGDALAAGADPQSLLGQTVGGFELLEELGHGAMGVVYKARQQSLDRSVALKMIVRDLVRDRATQARFLTEARAIAQLNHPHIVSIYHVGECIFGRYFAMALVEGKTLESVLQKGPLPIRTVASLMIKVAEAVDYAHSEGIVHRDLKPSNIMIGRDKKPIIMDFGLAKVLGSSSHITEYGMGLGTPAYMAPEQTGETPFEVSPKTDIYSLGAVLYRALTGRAPFVEETLLRTIWKIISSEPAPSLRKIRPDVPKELDRICLRCLEKKPSDRYPSASSLALELRSFRASFSEKNEPAASLARVCLRRGKRERELSPPTATLGRAAECDIVLNTSQVSKHHCRIWVGTEVTVEDLDSANGTFVNGRRVERTILKDGDVLRVPGHRFRVEITPAAG